MRAPRGTAARSSSGPDGRAIGRLLEIMARLRDPRGGCPWDLEQTPETLARYAIEEAYEVEEAVRRGDRDGLRDELGDLLLQVVFHAQLAREAGDFDFDEIAGAIGDKLERRHPHVFGDAEISSAQEQTQAWEAQKAAERAEQAEREDRLPSALDGVPTALPALLRASKLIGRAAREGFAWPDARAAWQKLAEETQELGAELDGASAERAREELGDLLFAAAGVARALELDPEQALREANAKFERRLRALERNLADEGRTLSGASPEELLERWRRQP